MLAVFCDEEYVTQKTVPREDRGVNGEGAEANIT